MLWTEGEEVGGAVAGKMNKTKYFRLRLYRCTEMYRLLYILRVRPVRV